MRIDVFDYPPGPEPAPVLWEAFEGIAIASGTVGNAGPMGSPRVADEKRYAEIEMGNAEELRRSFEAGREGGRQEGRAAEQEAHAVSLTAQDKLRVEYAARLVEGFAQERERYLLAVEPEVVRLALAIAARILRREAQMDPLLLTGAVRVALGQLSSSTQVRLRVPPAELDLWSEVVTLLPNLSIKPQVLPGEGMRLGDCVIETEMGTADLGVRAQLAEIERGFFDRAGGSPAPVSEQLAGVERRT